VKHDRTLTGKPSLASLAWCAYEIPFVAYFSSRATIHIVCARSPIEKDKWSDMSDGPAPKRPPARAVGTEHLFSEAARSGESAKATEPNVFPHGHRDRLLDLCLRGPLGTCLLILKSGTSVPFGTALFVCAGGADSSDRTVFYRQTFTEDRRERNEWDCGPS
jgi:hypothetical protein